jgi:DNA-binding HxlR family transcriptional regulator
MPKRYNQACPVAKTLELVGDRWTLLVVRDLLRGTQRFQDLLASLPGIAPNILSERLKLMERHGLVARRFYSEHPPRADYALTDRGRELGLIVGALAAWGTRHVYKRARLVHAGQNHPVTLRYYCPDCAAPVRGADVSLKRGPGPGGAPRARGGTRASGDRTSPPAWPASPRRAGSIAGLPVQPRRGASLGRRGARVP